MYEIFVVPASIDNYIFFIRNHKNNITAVVDPTEASVVLSFLKEKKWSLQYILNTHHHIDHINGNLELKAHTGCQILGFKNDAARIPGIDIMLTDLDLFRIGDLEFQVMELPGHTLGHIAYYSKEIKSLFSGDVLFGLGCGRVFEGTHSQMLLSLNKIKCLPSDTQIYCSHEYTDKNINFAQTIEPKNSQLLERITIIREKRHRNEFTVPLLLSEELETNPFVRTHTDDLKSNLKISDELALFSYLRNYRDSL
jgi:hydroxyacylglutathione hydrolase